MEKERKNRNASELGQRLLNAMRAKNYEPATFADKLANKLKTTKRDSILQTLSKIINGSIDKLPKKWFSAVEELLEVSIAHLMNTTVDKPLPRPGLFEVGTYGNYDDFVRLDKVKED